ncbi:MAG: hypothetical protein KGK17_10925 [Betaproteobacteria bacterium]|nr:hypothetical protein [Betaproteobacteria bacterium]
MMDEKKSQLDPDKVLQQALIVMQPLVLWLLRSGVRHPEFSVAIKQTFLEQAASELERLGGKQTDSAISMLSGLHRKDVRAMMIALARQEKKGTQITRESLGRPTLPSQVMTRWLTSGWPDELPMTGDSDSFEALSRQVSSDVHPRAVLNELVRLGMAVQEHGAVRLCRSAFVPDQQMTEAGNLLAGSTADHLAAGVHNLSGPGTRKFLEQSVFADGLNAESIQQLEHLASALWMQVLNALVHAAVPLSEKDEPAGGDQRIRVGMFCYSEPARPKTPRVDKKKARKPRRAVKK